MSRLAPAHGAAGPASRNNALRGPLVTAEANHSLRFAAHSASRRTFSSSPFAFEENANAFSERNFYRISPDLSKIANFWRARSRLYRSQFLKTNASNYSFCNIFQALHDLRTSASRQTDNVCTMVDILLQFCDHPPMES